jgi:hypothetical protein
MGIYFTFVCENGTMKPVGIVLRSGEEEGGRTMEG